MKTASKESGDKEGTVKGNNTDETQEIKTDFPLSEKDEVKQAEERMRKSAKKTFVRRD